MNGRINEMYKLLNALQYDRDSLNKRLDAKLIAKMWVIMNLNVNNSTKVMFGREPKISTICTHISIEV